MKILSIFGTRPEAIKMAPVIRLLKSDPRYESIVCVTAQHREMLDQMLEEFEIVPDIDLNIMSTNQSLFDITTKVLTTLNNILNEIRPERILIQGDTTTCFSASLAAYYLNIPVGHIEAGIRSGNIKSPFPEEINRSLVSRIADMHFAPNSTCKTNLLNEGISGSKIYITGNTVIDSLNWIKDKISSETRFPSPLNNLIPTLNNNSKIILVTTHRRENFGKGMISICSAIRKLAESHKNWHFVYPIHQNPRVQTLSRELFTKINNIHIIPPLSYSPFIKLMIQSTLIITDSGGVQEEASYLGKPALIIRDTCDRPETIDAGNAILTGLTEKKIIQEVESILSNHKKYSTMSTPNDLYGDGTAAKRIIEAIMDKYHERSKS